MAPSLESSDRFLTAVYLGWILFCFGTDEITELDCVLVKVTALEPLLMSSPRVRDRGEAMERQN